jgi:Leucine-rich repeat (LRR) protein
MRLPLFTFTLLFLINQISYSQSVKIDRNNFKDVLSNTFTEWEKVDSIDFAGVQISELPEQIFKCVNVKHISFFYIQYQTYSFFSASILFEQLKNFPKLSSIYLDRLAEFDSIPREYWQKIKGIQYYNNQIVSSLYNFKNLEALYFWNRELNQIPENIDRFKHLKSLAIRSNCISELPAGVGNLSQLTEFYFDGRSLKRFPLPLFKLKKLQALGFSNGTLDSIPAQIFKLKNIRYLNLSNNQIQNIPEEIGELTQLQALYLNGNRISFLPSSFDKLQKLTKLQLSSNQINVFPSELYHLPLLTNISLEINNITVLPEGIEKLQHLQRLYLRGNDSLSFTSVCNALIKSNKYISISCGNSWYARPEKGLEVSISPGIPVIPSEIGNIKNLISLELEGQFVSIPNEIGKLKHLSNLVLEGNYDSIPVELFDLDSIATLVLKGNYTEIPEEIAQLSHLTQLRLAGKLQRLPDNMFMLKNLEVLDLSDNQLTEVPSKLNCLTNLTTLSIDRNKIKRLSNDLFQMNHLEELSFQGNPLDSLPDAFFSSKFANNNTYIALLASCAETQNAQFSKFIRSKITDSYFDLPELGNMAYYFVFAQDFESGIWAGEKYLEQGGDELGFISNLAMAYLCNGNYTKASEIYARYKDAEQYENQGENVFLTDLYELKERNIAPERMADIEKVIAFLEE